MTAPYDGPGIAEGQRERAFQMFQTLRPRDEVEGSGMGLAIIRKLVDRIGGTIDVADRTGGRGAEFCFSWPGGGEHIVRSSFCRERGTQVILADDIIDASGISR